MCPYRQINKHLPTIRKTPDDLWDEIEQLLPPEKKVDANLVDEEYLFLCTDI